MSADITPVPPGPEPHVEARPPRTRDLSQFVVVGVRVVIEGPEGTDPYRAGPCPNDCLLDNSVCLKPAGERNYACSSHADCALDHRCGSDSFCRKICPD